MQEFNLNNQLEQVERLIESSNKALSSSHDDAEYWLKLAKFVQYLHAQKEGLVNRISLAKDDVCGKR